MNRKKFLRKAGLIATSAVIAPEMLRAELPQERPSDYDQFMNQVGFNHLPNKEDKEMNTVIHRAETRGHANHGWLNSRHTFSFANYRNPERMHFGVLRVLNDDIVAEGKGFGTHPHDNMEIISIPLLGDLEHKDSMGNTTVIREGDVQVMSAGTGVFHSEYNKNADQEVKFLQIWLFPNKKNVDPRYDQITLNSDKTKDQWNQVLSPNKEDDGVWIYQDAWFHIGKFTQEKSANYTVKKKGNGVYAFILEGSVEIEGTKLNKRDGMGIWDVSELKITTQANSKILLMEVPMEL